MFWKNCSPRSGFWKRAGRWTPWRNSFRRDNPSGIPSPPSARMSFNGEWNMRHKIRVEASAWILLSLLLVSVPLNWVLGAVTAAAVHELCHIAMLRILNISVDQIRIGARGAVMDTAPMEPKQELLCALSGPAGSLLLSLFLIRAPRIALCGLVQGIFNLLPLFPMDGGRVLRCLISLLEGKIPCKRKHLRVQ